MYNYCIKILIFLALFHFISSYSQENIELKNLLNLLEKPSNESQKLELLCKIISILPEGSVNKIDFLLQAEKIAIQQNNIKKLNFIYHKLAVWHAIKSDYTNLVKYSLKLNANAEKTNDVEGIIRSYLFVSQSYMQNIDQLNKSLYYLNKAEKIILKTNSLNYLNDVYTQKGFIEYYKNNFEKAIQYYDKSIALVIKSNSIDLPGLYIEKGLAYTQLGKADQAFAVFEKAKVLLDKYPNINHEEKIYLHSDIGLTYVSIKNYKKAIESFNTSMQYALEAKNGKTQMENHSYLAQMYQNLKDPKNELIHTKKYHHLKDSLFSAEKNVKQTELIADYEIEKKNTLVAQKELENTKSKNQRNIFIGVAFTTLLLLGFMLYFYKRIQKKNVLISNQKASLEELNKVKDRLFAILSHDLRNPLVTLKSFLSLSTIANLTVEKREKYQFQTNQSLENTTNLLDDLLLWANSQLKNTKYNTRLFNLENSILEILENVQPQAYQKNITFKTNLEAKETVSNEKIIELSLRNILTNAIKFSPENSQITIQTFHENKQTYIKIQDFGIGMTPEKINEILALKSKSTLGTNHETGNGLGLFLVIEMLSKINTKLLIESKPNNGSTFTIIF